MIRFTKKQKNVIEHRGKSLLVKASAGTGKTTVMINRILQLIEERQVSVSNILVVTFTNAAASEMRTRLLEALNEKAHQSEYAAAEADAAETASISTIHGFCNECVRRYFYLVDIDPNYIISANLDALKTEVLKKVLDRHYKEGDEDFLAVLDIFGRGRRDSALVEAIKKIHEFIECCPDFKAWRESVFLLCRGNFYAEAFISHINKSAEAAIRGFEAFLSENQSKFNDYVMGCIDKIKPLCGKNLHELIQYAESLSFDRLKPAFANETARYEEFKEYKNSVKERLNKFGDVFDDAFFNTQASLPVLNKLLDIAEEFTFEFNKRKVLDATLDFSDLERLALEILNNNEALSEIRERYKMIFLDEYQDVNDVQEAIISKLGGANGFFAVGDTKQSIYGFRQSRPENFLKREDAFGRGDGEVFDLSDNFRSHIEILDFVNRVMRRVMTADFGKCNYERDGSFTREDAAPLDIATCDGGEALSGSENRSEGAGGEKIACGERRVGVVLTASNNEDEAVMEADAIASRIHSLVGKTIEGKAITYGNIAILTRRAKDYAQKVRERLTELGIKVETTFDERAEANAEVNELLHFLRILNNPFDDISLYGAMISHIGGFTVGEAAKLREECPDTDLYNALCNSREKKAFDLCALIEKYRFFSQSLSVGNLLLRLVEECRYDLYVLRLPDGHVRTKTLNAFLNGLGGKPHAATLNKFIEYVDNGGKLFDKDKDSLNDSVKMMTMHGAKGLEYDVVFIIEAHARFRPVTGALLLDKEMGAAVSFYDKNEKQIFPTLASLCLRHAVAHKEKEEELRLLYVALTRAKHYLYVLGSAQKAYTDEPSDAKCMLDWIMSGALSEEVSYYTEKERGFEKRQQSAVFRSTEEEIRLAEKALSFKYRYSGSEIVPVKLSPSRLDIRHEEIDSSSVRFLNEHTTTDLGTAYHKLIEQLPFSATEQAAQTILSSLIDGGYIEKSVGEKIDVRKASLAMRHPQILRWADECESRREIPFIMNIPYSEVYPEKASDDTVLMQGIIDLLFYDRQNNAAFIIDYKFTVNEQSAVKQYAAQTAVYAHAAKKILKADTVKTYVYSIISGTLIPM